MKRCLALCLWLLAGYYAYAQPIGVSCSLNAGGDQFVCFDEASFTLNGVIEGDVQDITWVDAPNDQFEFSNVNSLTPTITPANGVEFLTGTFVFTVNGNCDGDPDDPLSSFTTVFIDGPVAEPVLTDTDDNPLGEEVVTCTSITIRGTAPGPGDEVSWVLSNDQSIQVSYSADFTEITLVRSDYTSSTCQSVTAFYTISNGGCEETVDVLVIFEGTDPTVEIENGQLDGRRLCGDTLSTFGSDLGCKGTRVFEYIDYPGNEPPDFNYHPTDARFIETYFTETGWYTLTYTVTSPPPCQGGMDTARFYVCVTDVSQFSLRERFILCEDFPSTIELETTLTGENCTLTPWTIGNGTGDATIEQNPDNPAQATATILNQDADIFSFSQRIYCDSCFVETPDGIDTILCFATHTVLYLRGPDFDVDADTLDFACGGSANFRPWNHVEFSGQIDTRRVRVIDKPLASDINTSATYNQVTPFDIRDEGQYVFRLWGWSTENGVTCSDTTYLTVNVCETEDPNSGVTANFTTCDTVQLAGSIPFQNCAQLWWQQIDGNMEVEFIGPNNISNPWIYVSEPGTYYLEYSYSRTADCYLADTLEIVVEECDSLPCVEMSMECVVNDKGEKCYEFEIRYQDPEDCSMPFSINTTTGNIIDYTVDFELPHTYIIRGTYKGDPGYKEFCYSIDFKDKDCEICGYDFIIGCEPLPECPCVVSSEELFYLPKCVETGDEFCIKYVFDYCGPDGMPIEWFSNNPQFELVSATNGTDDLVDQGSNSWELCFRFVGKCHNNSYSLLDISGSISKTDCRLRQQARIKCCGCRDFRNSIRVDTCIVNDGQLTHGFTVIVEGVGNAGVPFLLTSNTLTQPMYGWDIIDGNLVITGGISGQLPGFNFCVDVNFENPDICDIEGLCVPLPFCCEEVEITQPELECDTDGAGNVVYNFYFEIEDIVDLTWPFSISADCGEIELNPIVQDATTGNFIVTGTISNLTAEPGEKCCFDINFKNKLLCDAQVCVEIPACDCYEDLVVEGPDCIDRESPTFCMTYTFDYYGPPTTGVSIIWYTLPGHDDDLVITSMTNNTVGATGSEVVAGTNTWEFCFEYIGDCAGEIPLEIKAVMFTSLGIQCCSFDIFQDFECCCVDPEIKFQWCGISGEQIALVDRVVNNRDNKLESLMQKWLKNESGCGDSTPESEKERLAVEQEMQNDSCCFICEDGVGPIFALDATNCEVFDPMEYFYDWSGDPILGGGGNNPFVVGIPNTTYTVTVTDSDGCSSVAVINIDCEGTGGDGRITEKRMSSSDEEQLRLQELLVYPNPANDYLFISSPLLQKGQQLYLYDLTGRLLQQRVVTTDAFQRLNTDQLPQGTYFLQVRDVDFNFLTSKRVVIVR